jgi:flagellar hook assembly protein FlgD
MITYTLNANSDVTITIYDELGYLVKTISCASGNQGGFSGLNFVPWDGRNDAGVLVAKGGYIARIRVKSPGGAATAIRKIGVIH